MLELGKAQCVTIMYIVNSRILLPKFKRNMKQNCTKKELPKIENNVGIDKEWLSFDDICFLYGITSQKGAYEIRIRKEITVSKHPLNNKKYIYLRSDIEEKIRMNTIHKQTMKGEIIDFEEDYL
jgi:hypothetical protein